MKNLKSRGKCFFEAPLEDDNRELTFQISIKLIFKDASCQNYLEQNGVFKTLILMDAIYKGIKKDAQFEPLKSVSVGLFENLSKIYPTYQFKIEGEKRN